MIPLKNPSPDFRALEEILKGERAPDKVHFVEFGVDFEVIKFITEKMIGQTMPSINEYDAESNRIVLTKDAKALLKSIIDFYYYLGYDYVPTGIPSRGIHAKVRVTDDTALLSRGKREWVEEKEGVITSWEDFESFPWDRTEIDFENYYQFLNRNLPEGMKVTIASNLYETVGERLLGWEGMFRKLYVEPDLVKAVFNRWGEIVYKGYEKAISFECVGAMFHPDDLGYKKGLMVKPNFLKEIVFPWFEKYASLAHQHNKMYWYHCCGNVFSIMENLIQEVRIDAFHAFQDVIMPVWEFKERYGEGIAVLGGVDVDKLARLDEGTLRKYVNKILDKCMPEGRYALGSGNTIANYVPIQNYLTMLEEGSKWK